MTNWKISKRSQMEAFGLAVIVVLIILGFFIFIAIRSQNPQKSPLNYYVPEQTASNFVNSIVNVDVAECSGYSVSDLVRFCQQRESVASKCSVSDSCVLLNDTFAVLLNRSLARQNFAYRFYTQYLGWPDGGEITIVNRGCNEDMEHEHGELPVVQSQTYSYNPIFLKLDICK